MAVGENVSTVTEFLLLGFPVPFLLFLGIYLLALAGYLGLVLLTGMDSHLQSPVLFLLGNLSFVAISDASSVAPKMLWNFFREQKTTAFVRCSSVSLLHWDGRG
ncbi:Olfactory receptor 5M1 [Sciurus carolinensis]|uniref:Olfactory receptor 5M1 n=1 Tax=Sciurus carolinensis TaxID=30640 RepID=A0AA41T2N9_SCICA|nr:Olfactory receptor 5M1 [Sciurus carolinensis]